MGVGQRLRKSRLSKEKGWVMINIEKGTKLLETIKKYREQFDYNLYFDYSKYDIVTAEELCDCGTSACLAGWTIYLFKKDFVVDNAKMYMYTVASTAAEILELSPEESFFLFNHSVKNASFEDAISRLTWLLEGKDYRKYDFSKESYNV